MKFRNHGIIIFAFALSCVFQASAANAFQAGIKGGYHLYPSSDYLDFIEGAEVSSDAGQLDGPCLEAYLDFSILPLISLELGAGGHISETSLGSGDNNLELTGRYLLLTPKVHLLPFGSNDLYAGLGAGYYRLGQDLKVKEALFSTNDKGGGGVHATIGWAYSLSPNFLILVEGRYVRAVIENADSLGHDFDMGGLYVLAGASLAW